MIHLIKDRKNKRIKNIQERDYGCIDFYSPFFDSLYESTVFKELFTILISTSGIERIKSYNLVNYFCNKFNDLNKLEINYESLRIEYSNNDCLTYFEKFNINYNQLKKLEIWNDSKNEVKNYNPNYFIFPIIRKATNLIHLSIAYITNFKKSDPSQFNFINNFKYLEYLKIEHIKFNSKFLINLPTLKYLEIKACDNVEVTDETYKKLNTLDLIHPYEKYLIQNHKLNLLSDLKELKISYIIDDKNQNINLQNLKIYEGNLEIFNLIESPLLEEAKLEEEIISFKQFQMIMNKICTLKNLKVLYLKLNILIQKDEDISKIKFENNSLMTLYVDFKEENYENSCKIFSKLKFNNILNLTIINSITEIQYKKVIERRYLFRNLIKLKNLDINIKYDLGFNISFHSCENLETFHLSITKFVNDSLNFEFPILIGKCKKKFTSLKSFKLYINGRKLNADIFNNIYNNLDNLLNLVDFSLHLNIKKDQLENVINKYIIFCEKILSKKYIRRINIELFDGPIYLEKNLVEMFPNLNFKKYYEVKINKLPTEFYFSPKNVPNSKMIKDVKNYKDIRNDKDVENIKGVKNVKDVKNVRDVKDANDNKGAKNDKNNKNSKGNRCTIY